MWGSKGAYAYDRQLKKTVRLTGESNFTAAIMTNDAYLLWTQMSEENIEKGIRKANEINIIRIEDLPTY